MRQRWIPPILLAVFLCGLWYGVRGKGGGDSGAAARPSLPAQGSEGRDAPSIVAAPEDERPAAGREGLRESGTDTVSQEPEDLESSDPDLTLRARVLDVSGRALSAVPVRVVEVEGNPLLSDDEGLIAFRMPPEVDSLRLEVSSQGPEASHATVRSCTVRRAQAEADHILIAAPAVRMTGRVVDEGGVPLAGVRVGSRVGSDLVTDFPFPMDSTNTFDLTVTSDSAGRFELWEVPLIEGHRVTFFKEGFVQAAEGVGPAGHTNLLVTLVRTQADCVVEGRVLLPDGSPAEGAKVQYGSSSSLTDESGRFSLELEDIHAGSVLAAGLRGYGPAFQENFFEVLAAAAPQAPPAVELRLTEPLSISGRIEDDGGQPLSGWMVWFREGLSITHGSIPPDTVETIAGSGQVMTTSDGRFEIEGLLDRDYRVWAFSSATLQAVESAQPVPAGTRNLVLVAPKAELRTIAGRVVSRRGIPLGKVEVGLQRITYRTPYGWMAVSGETSVQTDQEGRFSLEHVPSHGIAVTLSGPDVMPGAYDLGPAQERELGGPEALRLSVAQRCHFRLEVIGKDTQSLQLELLDEGGAQLPIFAFQSNGWTSSSRHSIGEDGRTSVLAASEDARELVLWRDAEEVYRGPVALTADEVNALRIAY